MNIQSIKNALKSVWQLMLSEDKEPHKVIIDSSHYYDWKLSNCKSNKKKVRYERKIKRLEKSK